MSHPRLAYLMSRFPHLPETFILREMVELKANGYALSIYPLVRQKQSVVHPEAAALMPAVRWQAAYSPAVAAAALQAFVRQPAKVVRLWLQVARENRADRNMFLRALLIFPQALWMAREMQREGIEHIHAHYATHPALAAWIISQMTGIPYSLTVHAHDIYVRRAMLPTKLRGARFVAAISQFNRDFLAREVGEWVRSRVHVVHCGILPEHYPQRLAGRRGEEFELLSIGSLQPYKGQQVLITACRLLRDQGLNFRCRIVGSGELRDVLQAQIDTLGLADRVTLSGPRTQSEVAAMLAESDCYVQPSVITPAGKMEGIPVALMEALACGLPVAATQISGIPELVRAGDTGWLVAPEDPAALADAVLEIYRQPQEAARRGNNGRALVLAEFDLRANVARLAELLENSPAAGVTAAG